MPWVCVTNLNHSVCDTGYCFAQFRRREDFDLVAVAEYPPGYFAESVNAEIHDRRTVRVAGNFLGLMPLYLGDVIGDFRREPQADVIHLAFRYH